MRVIGTIVRRLNKVDPRGIPWVAVALWQAGMLVVVIVAIAQRAAHPLVWTILAGLLAVIPGLYYRWRGRLISPVAAALALLIATALLIFTHPVVFDVAPLILMFGLGVAAIYYSVAACTVIAGAFAAVLIGASLTHRIDGLAVYLSLLATALAVGYFVAMERRLLVAERRAQQSLREHAASEERRRIAREIHDMVADSLSVTLLHLTAARRELQQDGDVGEAVNALVDAERLGRYAMADIRRTVGLLETGPTSTTAEPGIDDIIDLIHDFEKAGLALDYHIDGTSEHVSPSTGLGIYRICQESLANIVKHAPTAKADMALCISAGSISLSISNDIAHPHAGNVVDAYGGAGLRGMKQRTQLLGGWLHAELEHSRWTVTAHIPLPDPQPPIR